MLFFKVSAKDDKQSKLVCGICKMDCMSTEKIVCLLKNAGRLQSIAAAAVGFFHLRRQHLAPD